MTVMYKIMTGRVRIKTGVMRAVWGRYASSDVARKHGEKLLNAELNEKILEGIPMELFDGFCE